MKHTVRFFYESLKNGIKTHELKAIPGGEISCISTASIKKSITCQLILPEDVDLLFDEVRVSIEIDGTRNPLGIFRMTTAPTRVDSHGTRITNCEGYDRTLALEQKRLETRTDGYIATGTKYTDAIKSFLIGAGIREFILEESEDVIRSEREDWDVGTSYLEIINQLLDEMNYTTIYFDANGIARAERYLDKAKKPIKFRYSSGKDSIILREHTVSDDTFNSYNVFIVGVSAQDREIFRKSENNDPISRLSTVRRGRIVAPVTMLSDAPSEDAIQAYADRLVFQSRQSTEVVTISTGIEAGHEVFDAIELNHPDIQGKFEETEWRITLQPGALMQHTIRRIRYV